ncbi:MAG: glycerophosphodiester phosphodiesterase [Firmicutes bacterium]|nr:glycerophosphodiester phosphodiesterase [Bacillota bacterium]
MFQYPSQPRPFFWGHRGLPACAVENTLAAFAASQRHGMPGIECDVQWSRDGVPFIFHDDTLERLGGSTHVAQALSWKDLAALRLVDPERPHLGVGRIPTLAELVEWLPQGLALNCEIKDYPQLSHAHLASFLQLIAEYHLEDRVLVSSFNHAILARVRSMASHIALATLWDGPIDYPTVLKSQQLTPILHVPLAWAERPTLEALHSLGFQLGVWGARAAADVRRLVGLGVDAVFIDDPNWLPTPFPPQGGGR